MEHITKPAYPPETREEVLSWLPEIEDINDEELCEQVLGVFLEIPNYFWHAPAASRHHPPEHRARHGLVLHTKRVCTAFERVAKSMVKQNHLTWADIDEGRAACLLHDTFKYGMPPTAVDNTSSSHDVIAANFLRENTQLSDAICDAVESHSGPWYRGKVPTTHLEQMVHMADLAASDENAQYAVKDMNVTLKEKFPRVNER